MTSRSTSKKYHPGRHAFAIALREGMAAGIIGALLLTALIAGKAALTFQEDLQYHQVLYYYSGTLTALPQTLLVTLMGFIQALFAFKFLYNRAASGTYFSLGISRGRLFGYRYAAGACWLAAGVLAAMLGGAAVNLLSTSSPGLALARAVPLAAGLLATALIAFSVTAAVCSRSGTLVEALIYSVLALLLPTLLLTGLGGQMVAFLRGTPYGVLHVYAYDMPGSLTAHLTVLNPPAFFSGYLAARGSLTAGETAAEAAFWGPMLAWLAVSAALTLLARLFFMRRRVENTGIRGACKPLAFIVLFPLVYAAFSAFLYLSTGFSPLPLSGAMAGGLALSAGVFCAVAFPMWLIDRPAWKGLLVYPAYLAGALLAIGILAGGGLGYSGYLPDAGEVESMQISYKGLPGVVSGGGGYGMYADNTNMGIRLTTAGDLALGRSLHKALIDDTANEAEPSGISIRTQTYVEYTLKDGRVVQRYYPSVTLGVLERMLSLDETDAFRTLWDGYMEGVTPEYDPHRPYNRYYTQFTDGVLYASAPLSEKAVRLDDETAARVRQALREDMAAQSLSDRYFPAQAERYMLFFCTDSEANPSPWICPYGWDTWSTPLFIGESCPRTLALLTEALGTPELPEIESVEVLCPLSNLLASDTDSDLTAVFNTLLLDQDSASFWVEQKEIQPLYETADPDRIARLWAVSRGFYFAGDGGYIAYVKLKDSDVVFTRYIPLDLLPDWAA